MNVLAFLTVLLIATRWSDVTSEDKPCSCEEGQFCDMAVQPVVCQPCPHGTYLSQPVHDKTGCKPWTTKGPDSNYVLKKNGTRISDNEWECDVGFAEKEFTVGEYECVKIDNPSTTTVKPTPTTSHTSVTSTPRYEGTTTAVPSKKESLSEGIIALIVVVTVVVVVVILVIILINYFCRQDFKLCSEIGNRSENASTGDIEGRGNESLPLDTSVPDRLGFKNYFTKIVGRLGKEIYAFINLLDDSDRRFNAKSTIDSKLKKHSEPEKAYNEACMEWVKKTKLDHKKCIIDTLLEMKKHDLIDELFPQQEDALSNLARNDDENNGAVGGQNSGEDSTTRKTVFQPHGQEMRAKADSKLFKLYYHLVKFIGVQDSEKLLKLLPNKNLFSVENSIQNGQRESKELEVCHIETFIEWKKTNRDVKKLKDIIVNHLSEIGRQDAAEDEKISNLISEHDGCFLCDPKDGHHPTSSNEEKRARSVDNFSNRLNIYDIDCGAIKESNPEQSTRRVDEEQSDETEPLINNNANENASVQASDRKKQNKTHSTTLDEDEVDHMPSSDETAVKVPLINDIAGKNENTQAIDNPSVQTPGSKKQNKANPTTRAEDEVGRLPSFDETEVKIPLISDNADEGKKKQTLDSRSMQTPDFKEKDNIDPKTVEDEEDVRVMPSSDETAVKMPPVNDNVDECEKTRSTISFPNKNAPSVSVRPVGPPTSAKSVNADENGRELDLFYLLDRKLGKEDSKTLLEQLPNDYMKFNAKTSLHLGKSRPNVVVETLCTWREHNPLKDLKACIMDGLKQLGRNDIVEDKEFVNHISHFDLQPPTT